MYYLELYIQLLGIIMIKIKSSKQILNNLKY